MQESRKEEGRAIERRKERGFKKQRERKSVCVRESERERRRVYSVVTDFARLRGKSTSTPFMTARWYESS